MSKTCTESLKTEIIPNCGYRLNSYRAVNTLRLGYEHQSLFVEMHTERINVLCGKNVEFYNAKLCGV
jgi:hypothetical protein